MRIRRGGHVPSPLPVLMVLLGTLVPTGLVGQIPGGKPGNLDQSAVFRAAVLGEVRPVMESWQGAWRGQGDPSIESHYATDAVLAAPGGPMIGGRGQIAEFARAARPMVGVLATSMLDFAAGDGMALVYGRWDSGGNVAASGRLVTVLVKSSEHWLIRLQLFTADSLPTGVFPAVPQPEPLPALAERIGSGASARRGSVYHDLLSQLASLRRAWAEGDARTAKALMRDDAWLQLPGHGASAGPVTVTGLAETLSGYGGLNTVELDFEASGSLAYLAGRYYVEQRSGPPRAGSYVAVFKRTGDAWLLRSLVFA